MVIVGLAWFEQYSSAIGARIAKIGPLKTSGHGLK
jgi:hypothetical protein